MPDFKTFKLEGTRLVPTNRFNLEPAKPSNSFTTIAKKDLTNFTVIEHPIIHSINIDLQKIDFTILNKYFPLIDGTKTIDENAFFKDYSDPNMTLFFPEIEIAPNNNTLFYYEDVLNKSGEKSGLLGRVTIKFSVKNKKLNTNERNIGLTLKEAILNLKVKNEVIKINGIVNILKSEIQFDLKDEAVKIAFLNLITQIEDLKCNIDLFFEFKAYSKFRKNFLVAKNMNSIKNINLFARDLKTENLKPLKTMIINDTLLVKNSSPKSIVSRKSITEIQKENRLNIVIQPELVKSTFLLKVNKTMNFPLSTDASTSLYKNINGGFITNPFNLNEDFSQFKQIFIPGINFDKLSVYKSTLQPNTFLLISKMYGISRDLDTMKPCISTIFHAYEEGASQLEEISKISFQFAVGPNLSEYDLAKLKIALLNNNFIDGDTSVYFDKIQFLFPSDIEADYDVSGNYFLQKSDISTDGKHFLFNLSTENLSEASIMINALNNTISQYANLNFKHKEIKDSSIIEINLEKTIGEIIESAIDNASKTIKIANKSISKCKLNAVLLIDDKNNPYFNSSFFETYPELLSNENKLFENKNLTPDGLNFTLKNVYFNFESLEDLSLEFTQIISQSTNYSRYIQVDIQHKSQATQKIILELTVQETENKFTIEKYKSQFSTPVLFNFIIKNSLISNTFISYKINYFDKNENLIKTENNVFDFSASSRLVIN